jgi:hypothetical protein
VKFFIGKIVRLWRSQQHRIDPDAPFLAVLLDADGGFLRVGSLDQFGDRKRERLPAALPADDEQRMKWVIPTAHLGNIEFLPDAEITPEMRAEADRLVRLASPDAAPRRSAGAVGRSNIGDF